MKQKKTNVILAVLFTALATLTACSAGDEVAQDVRGGMPIVLSTTIGGTRSVLQQSDFASGETVKVWAKYTSDSWTVAPGNAIDAWQLTADGGGNLSGPTHFYPLRDAAYKLDFVAIHGTNLRAISEGKMPFSVRLDQNSVADYAASDLLVATKSAVSPSNDPVLLSFVHKLAKIEVRVTSSKFHEALLENKCVVKVKAVPSGKIDLSTGAVTTDTKTADNYQKITARRVTTSDAYYDSGECSGLHFEAVIPAQSKADTEITVNIFGVDVPVTRNDNLVTKYEAGNTYTYTVDLTSDVALPTGRGVELTSASIAPGWVICDDGKAYAPADAALVPYVAVPVAVVAYVGNGDSQNANGSSASHGFTHGLALALADCNRSNCTWPDPYYAGRDYDYQRWCSQESEVCLSRRSTDVATVREWSDGLACTQALVSHASHVGTHYAAIAASSYKYAADVAYGAHPSGTSDWFLPSMGQWNLMVKSMCASGADLTTSSNANNNNANAFNVKIISAGGTRVQFENKYWSSTEYSAGKAWYMYFDEIKGYASSDWKTYGHMVRAVLAF